MLMEIFCFPTKVNDVMYYMLSWDKSKYGFKRQDIIKNVLKNHSRAFPAIFKNATNKLLQVYGIETQELTSKKGHYITVNTLGNDVENPHITWTHEEYTELGLLSVVLAIIYMNGNVITERDLWRALGRLGIFDDTHHHEYGNVKKLVTKDFVRKSYLQYQLIPQSDPPSYQMEWGERALAEVSKLDLLNVVCQIYGDSKPEDWVAQYEDAVA